MNASTTPTTNHSAGETGGSEDSPGPCTNSEPSAGSSESTGDADIPPEPEPQRIRPAIELSIDTAVVCGIDRLWLLSQIERMVDHLPAHVPSASFATIIVMVVDDPRMASLHREHCNRDSTTDVLTFIVSEPDKPIEAEIAACADEAVRRTKELDHSIEQELLLYVLHGLLHCCGFDDHNEADFQRMHQMEDAILEAINVGPTFEKES